MFVSYRLYKLNKKKMIKNLQGMLSPSKKKRTFQPDQPPVAAEYDPQDADLVSTTNTPERSSRFMGMSVLKASPKLTDENESSPGMFVRRRKSSIAKEEEGSEQLSFSPSYEDAEKKGGSSTIQGNIRGFFTRRKSMGRSEEVVLSPAESNDMYEDGEVEDIERSYLEEIFKRKQATMQAEGNDEEERSESHVSSFADNHNNNLAADNKSRRGRRRSVTRGVTAESRKRDEEEKGAGNFPVGETPGILDNHSRRRRRSMHARPYQESPRGKEKNVSDTGDTRNSMRLRRSSVPSVDDGRVKAEVTDKRTRRGRRSISEIADDKLSRNQNGHEKSDDRHTRRARRSSLGNVDIKSDLVVNDRRSRRGQRVIDVSVEKQSSEDKHDRKSRRTHRSLEIRDEGGGSTRERDIVKTRGETHSQTRNNTNIGSDRHKRRDSSRPRDRSRSPIVGSTNRSRSVSRSRNRDRSPTRKRSKSRQRTLEVPVTRERRRSRSRHRPSLASSTRSDVGHKVHGTEKGVNATRERDNADRQKNRDRETHKDRDGNRDKDRDRHRDRDRGADRKTRSRKDLAERGAHSNETGVRNSRSRRESTKDDQSSSLRSYLSDSFSTLDSSGIDEGSRGAHAKSNQIKVPTSRDRTSKSKNKLANYLPSDERIRLKHDLEIKSPSSRERKSKQNVDSLQSNIEETASRQTTGDKSNQRKTAGDLPEENPSPRNGFVRNESFSEGTDALVSKSSRNKANKGKEAMHQSEGVHDTQEISDPTTSPREKRSRSRRVALSSILDSDIGGEREADILSLAPTPTKPHTGSEGRRATLDPDRGGKSGTSNFSVFRPEHDSGRNLVAPEQSKVSNSSGDTGTSMTCNGNSSSQPHEVSDNLELKQNSFDPENWSKEVDSQPEQSGCEADILAVTAQAINTTALIVNLGGQEMAVDCCRLDLSTEIEEDKVTTKVAERSELLGNEERFHSDVDSAASYRKANIKNRDLIKMSREQRLGSKEARRGRDVSSVETTHDSVLSSPVSRRSHNTSRKSVKGMLKRGEKHARTKPHTRDHRDNRKRSLSPPRKNIRRRNSKDEGLHDSIVSSWRPPRIKERAADTSDRPSPMRRRRPSHQIEVRESNKIDEAPVEYEEEDVFTLYTWSRNRQDEDRVQRERLALKDSIRALSLFRAYESMETA